MSAPVRRLVEACSTGVSGFFLAAFVSSMVMTTPALAVGPAATVTTLAISATSVPYQSPVILTASVTSGGAPVGSGLVLFCDASAAVCESNSALSLVQLTTPGATATVKLGSGPLGLHNYKAVFIANGLYTSSTSNTVSYMVTGTYPSSAAVSSTGNVGNYTLSGTVAGIGSALTGPTGNVSFLDTSAGNNNLGTTALGSAALSNSFSEAPSSPFAIATSTTTRRSVAIASAYLNGDNNLDVVTGDYQQTVTVLLGNGDGTFQPKVNYAGCPSGVAYKILLADFNRDGSTDIALGCSDGTNGSLTILLGNGDGTFQAPTAFSAGDVAGIALGDFNRDGVLDFAVTNKSQKNVMYFQGNGDGTFAAGAVVLSLSSSLHDVVVADFNSDGRDDLLYAVSTATSGSPLSDLYLAAGNGDGTFQTPNLIASLVGEFLTVGDVNVDSFPDVVSTTITGTPPNVGPSLFVLIGNGDGTFKPKVTYQSDIPSDPHLADVNGDGKPDILAGGSYGALVYQGNGDGTFQPYIEPTIGNFALTYAVNAGDYNNDGNADLVGTDADSPRAAVSLSEVRQTAVAAALAGVALYPLGSGTHNVDASYSGDSIYASSVSSTIPLLAAPTPTTLTLVVTPVTATLAGQSVTLKATLSPYAVGPPNTTTDTEQVKFYNGSTLIGSGTLTSGLATLTTTTLPPGTDAIKAIYPGDANYNTSSSGTVNVTVASILIASSVNPSTFGQSVTFTATLAPGLTGTVTFKDGATVLGTSTISGTMATFTTTTLSVGLHDITGTYSGDGSHSAATSPVLTQEVDKATPTVTVTNSGPATYGSPVTITTTVPAGTTGTVTVSSGGVTLGTGTVDSNGTVTITTTTLPVGNDPITASYGGDSSNNPSTGTTSVTITKTTPTVTVTTSGPSSYGNPVTITTTVPPGTTGTVTVTSGTTTLGSGTVGPTGTVVITTSSLPAGSDPITASYGGDSTNNPATGTTTQTVTKANPTSTLTSSQNPSTAGNPVTFTDTLPTGVTGTVTFTSGTTVIGTTTVTNGTASITTSSLPAGSDPIVATYSGDSNNGTSVATLTQTVDKASPTLTVVTSGPSTYGGTVTITSTLPAGTTGTVTLTSGGVTVGSGTVGPNGTVVITTTSLPVGSDPITATYGGDSNNNPTTGSTTQTVSKATPTVTLTSSSNPSTTQQPVTFTATLPTNATGTITFYDGSTVLGTGTIVNGVATVTTSSLSAGGHTVTASYGGDANNSIATSGPLTQTVNKSTPVLPPPAVSSSNIDAATPVTISETVPAGVTGPVTFYDGGVVLGTAPIVNGVATLTVPSLPVGTDSITASTPADANNNAATSPATLVTVTKSTPQVAPPTVSSNNPTAGTPVTITQTIPPGVTGTVTFTNGGTPIGTAPIVNGTATLTTSTLPVGSDPIGVSIPAGPSTNPVSSPTTTITVVKAAGTVTLRSSLNPTTINQSVTFTSTVNPGATGSVTFLDGTVVLGVGTINSSGIATFSTSTLAIGTHSVTAVYSGDSNYSTATSTVLLQVVNKAPTAIMVSQSSSVQLSTVSVTFTASVTTSTPTPTGMVTFFDGTTALGTSPLSTNGTAVVSLSTSGNAAYSTNALLAGTHQITAVYSGDTGFMSSTSAPVSNIVADFTNVAKGEVTRSLFPGDTTTYTFLLTPVGSSTFLRDTTVDIDGLPAGTKFTFSPAVIPAGSGATTVMLTLTTSTSLSAENRAPNVPGKQNRSLPITLAALGILGLGAVRRGRKRMPRLMMVLLFSVASLLPIAAMTGCAGGYFTLTPTNYNLKVTGTEGPIQHTATTTLIVQ